MIPSFALIDGIRHMVSHKTPCVSVDLSEASGRQHWFNQLCTVLGVGDHSRSVLGVHALSH